ncbi:unnamed protein product, partial [Symbiodinium pilosum]
VSRVCRRQVVTLPQVPGVIFANSEIPHDKLVGQVRNWASASPVLSTNNHFDLLQVAEVVDGRALPRVLCGILRTRVQLAEDTNTIPAIATLFYRTREYLNQEFWEDQVRRICDIVAEEYLSGVQGVQLMVHHSPPWVMGLEVGEHRLLAEVEALSFCGPQLQRLKLPVDSSDGEVGRVQEDEEQAIRERHSLFHQFVFDQLDAPEPVPALERGDYVLRAAGRPVCGLSVLGIQPWRLVCGGAWADEGREPELAHLAHQLQRRARKYACTIAYDSKDERSSRLFAGSHAKAFGLLRRQRPLRIAVTGVPVGLSPEQQARLARAPFLIPWEFLPFHAGRVVLV